MGQLMVEGDKWEMYIPSELGYGDGGSGEKIKGGDMLIFRMEILEIKGGKRRAAKCDPATKENCESDEVEALEKWGKVPIANLQAELKALEKKSDEVLKAGEHDKIKAKVKMLKMVQKARKNGAEL